MSDINWKDAPEWATFHATTKHHDAVWCNDEKYQYANGHLKGEDYPMSNDGFSTYAKWELENIQYRPETTPRPHAELIKQWADDEDCVVEVKINNKWLVVGEPSWLDIYQYRIKPKHSSAKTELMDEIAKMEQALAELKAKVDQVE